MTYNIAWDTSANKDYFKDLLKDTFDTTAREALIEYKTMFREVKSGDEYERYARHAGLPDSEDINNPKRHGTLWRNLWELEKRTIPCT